VDFHFCDAKHHETWQKHRFHPQAYLILRSMPDRRAELLPAGVTTEEEEFLSRLEGRATWRQASWSGRAGTRRSASWPIYTCRDAEEEEHTRHGAVPRRDAVKEAAHDRDVHVHDP